MFFRIYLLFYQTRDRDAEQVCNLVIIIMKNWTAAENCSHDCLTLLFFLSH